MDKEDMLKFTQLYQQLLTENEEYQKRNEALYDSLQAVTQELEQLREQLRQINQMVMSYGGKNA